jgi:hypothetical protein
MDTNRKTLETRYKDQLAKMKAVRLPLKRITKIRCPIKSATLYEWYRTKKLVIADWNRDEVEKRVGTEADWMESLATQVSAGIFLAYSTGKPIAIPGGASKLEPTVENPIVVYEGGHRTRWTDAIFKNQAFYYDMDLATLEIVDPDTARAIKESVIEMTVATSDDAAGLVRFAKRDYDRVNTYTEKLKPGEVIRTHTDPVREKLENNLQAAMKRALKPKKRDSHLEDNRALVHCAAGLTDRMDKKEGSLTKIDPLTESQVEKANEVIAWWAKVESQIDALAEDDKKLRTRVRNRKIDLALDGTFMYALQSVGDADRQTVADDIVEFHRLFFTDSTVWSEVLKEIKKATKERSRYASGETPYPTRWLRIQNKIRPPAARPSEVAVEVPTAEPM